MHNDYQAINHHFILGSAAHKHFRQTDRYSSTHKTDRNEQNNRK